MPQMVSAQANGSATAARPPSPCGEQQHREGVEQQEAWPPCRGSAPAAAGSRSARSTSSMTAEDELAADQHARPATPGRCRASRARPAWRRCRAGRRPGRAARPAGCPGPASRASLPSAQSVTPGDHQDDDRPAVGLRARGAATGTAGTPSSRSTDRALGSVQIRSGSVVAVRRPGRRGHAGTAGRRPVRRRHDPSSPSPLHTGPEASRRTPSPSPLAGSRRASDAAAV